MSSQPVRRDSGLGRFISRYFVSAFVTFTFTAYAVHLRLTNTDTLASASLPARNPITLQLDAPTPAMSAAAPIAPSNETSASTAVVPAAVSSLPAPIAAATDAPAFAPTPVPAPELAQGQYRDGRYTGQLADAYYGNVQVQAVVQQGRIAKVQIPEYPSDRRTSVRINNVALPYLTSEVLQAQSANVDIISGATLTSEAFIQSLQSALTAAQG